MFIADINGMILWVIALLFKIAVVVAVVILVIKYIKYLQRKEAREMERDRRSAQDTINQIERELNDRKD